MEITEGGLDDPRVVDLLRLHVARAQAETAPGSAHALDPSRLTAPGVRFWTAWEEGAPIGCAALKRLSADHGEVESMHTAEAAPGRGVAGVLLARVMEAARRDGLARLCLETGSWPTFHPARALYRRHGFSECPPVKGYVDDPNCVFMTRRLDRA